jgi:tetratricopeptide (TPR) repeat protein
MPKSPEPRRTVVFPLLAALAFSACAVFQPRGPLGSAEDAFREGRYAVAEARAKAALSSASELSAAAQASSFLGGLASLQGRAPQAEAYYRQALASFERVSPDSQAVAATAYNLAGSLSLQGKNADAEPFFKRAVTLSDKPGAPQNELLDRLAAAGLFYEAQRRYDEALPYYQRAVAVAQKAGGERLKKAAADYDDLLYRKKSQARP